MTKWDMPDGSSVIFGVMGNSSLDGMTIHLLGGEMDAVQAHIEQIGTMTGPELFNLAGPDTYELLKALLPIVEPFNGEVQALAHAILLGELFAMLDHTGMREGSTELYGVDDRINVFVAQLRRAYHLSHEMRATVKPVQGH